MPKPMFVAGGIAGGAPNASWLSDARVTMKASQAASQARGGGISGWRPLGRGQSLSRLFDAFALKRRGGCSNDIMSIYSYLFNYKK